MIYRIYGQKDATIYEQTNRTAQNTGADEILEVTKFYDEDTDSIWIGNILFLKVGLKELVNGYIHL